jgi:Family of unknown function (DUF6261)
LIKKAVITHPPFKFLHKAEFLRLLRQVIAICGQVELIEQTAAALDALQQQLTPLEGQLAKWRREPLTEELAALDLRRDKALSGLHLLARACTRHHVPAIAEAGETLRSGMANFGKKLTLLNYVAKTTVIEALVSLIHGDGPMGQAANTLPLVKDWAAELQAANETFTTLYLNRSQSMAAKPAKTFTQSRPGVTQAYQLLASYLLAQQTLYPSAEIAQLIARLNELIEGYWKLVRDRGGSA